MRNTLKTPGLTTLIALCSAWLACTANAQTTIAKWTFETSYASISGSGPWITNLTAEVGSGTASGYHAGFGTTTFSSPAGNGSSHSFSANGWTNVPGDFFQFAVSTLGNTNITVSCDQISSGTGPGQFYLAYSLDGLNFTQFGDVYSVTSSPSWSSSSAKDGFNHTFDLSSVPALNNAPLVYFRLVDASTTSANGGTVATTGTSRVDDFTVLAFNPGPPTLTVDLHNTNVVWGENLTLSVAASGTPPLTYQWYYPDLNAPLVDGPSGYGNGMIAGSTDAALQLSFIDTNQAGNYQVIVSSPLGSVTSQVAQVTVSVPTPVVTNMAALHRVRNANYQLTDTTTLYQVEGIVTTPANLVQPLPAQSFFVEDSSGAGVDVFFRGGFTFPSAGDHVRITAPLLQFNGLLEMAPVADNPTHKIEILDSGNPLPTPRLFDFSNVTADLMEGSTQPVDPAPAIEGAYVVVSNVYVTLTNANGLMVAGGPLTMTNLTGQTFTLLVPNNSLLEPVGYPLPGNPSGPPYTIFASSVKGVVSQAQTSGTVLTNGYSVQLTLLSDIEVGTPPPPAPTPVALNIAVAGDQAIVTWDDATGLFKLASGTDVTGITNVVATSSPYTNTISGAAAYFRLVYP
jgi:hypothetical protein